MRSLFILDIGIRCCNDYCCGAIRYDHDERFTCVCGVPSSDESRARRLIFTRRLWIDDIIIVIIIIIVIVIGRRADVLESMIAVDNLSVEKRHWTLRRRRSSKRAAKLDFS